MKALDWATGQRTGSPTRKLVLVALANRANDQWSTWVGQERLAEDSELNIRTVRRALADLEAAGLISRTERRRDDGYRSSDLITLNPDRGLGSPDAPSPDRGSEDTVTGSGGQHHRPESPVTAGHRTESHLTLVTGSPDTDDSLTGQRTRAEPPEEPSSEPTPPPPTAHEPDGTSTPRGEGSLRTTTDATDAAVQAAVQAAADRYAAAQAQTGSARSPDGIRSWWLRTHGSHAAQQARSLLADPDPDLRLTETQMADVLAAPAPPAWLAHHRRRSPGRVTEPDPDTFGRLAAQARQAMRSSPPSEDTPMPDPMPDNAATGAARA